MAGEILGTEPTPSVETEVTPEVTPYDWKSDIHPDVKDSPLLKDIGDIKSLSKAYVDAHKAQEGHQKLPTSTSTKEEVEAFYKALGKPEKVDDYVVPADTVLDKEKVSALRQVALDSNMTQAQWQSMVSGYDKAVAADIKAAEVAMASASQTLNNEWGAAYDGKVALAQRAIRLLGGEETLQKVAKSGLGNDVGYIRMMVKVGESLVSDGLITGNVDGVTTKEDALKELNALTASTEYRSGNHLNHREAVEKAKKLFEIVYN